MEVVEKFLDLRRRGEGEAAYAMLAPGASFGCPWGGIHQGKRVRDLLLDEAKFSFRGYLEPVPIEQIAENTFQRRFKWNRGVFEQGNSSFGPWLSNLPTWREIYFVNNGSITLVTADKLRTKRSILAFFGF